MVVARMSNDYYMSGVILAVSLVHEGAAPHCLLTPLVTVVMPYLTAVLRMSSSQSSRRSHVTISKGPQRRTSEQKRGGRLCGAACHSRGLICLHRLSTVELFM